MKNPSKLGFLTIAIKSISAKSSWKKSVYLIKYVRKSGAADHPQHLFESFQLVLFYETENLLYAMSSLLKTSGVIHLI